MNRITKSILCGSTVVLVMLVAVSAPHIGQEPTAQPHVRPVSAFVREDRAIPPLELKPAFAGKETTNPETNSTPPTEIAFEPQKPNVVSEISTAQEPPRDKPTPEPIPNKNTASVTATVPQMCDTRFI